MAKTTRSDEQALCAANVRWMCDCMGFRTYKEAACALGVGYDWLRRAVTRGIGWTRGKNPDLEKLASYFDVPKDVFWKDSDDRLRLAVIAKAKPDYVTHCVTVEAVLRHYGQHRPNLLQRCLDVIAHYQQKIIDPGIESPEDRYCFVEASITKSTLSGGTKLDWVDAAVQERLSRLRLLPKREVLEEVVEARIDQERRHERLSRFRNPESWQSAKAEIVNMLVHIFSEATKDDGAVDDQTRAALTAVAEQFVQRLWEGEFAPEKAATKSSKTTVTMNSRIVVSRPKTAHRDAVNPIIRRQVHAEQSRLASDDHVETDEPSTSSQHALIKWTGSKRRQARQIIAQVPRRIEIYYEPFLGGGSVFTQLLDSDIEVRRFECSDYCEPLIELWKLVTDDPQGLVVEYAKNWRMLQSYGADHFKSIRREFNIGGNPHDLFFLLRTCRTGHVRFNQAGAFNGGFHEGNAGMAPEKVERLVKEWQRRLANKDVRFTVRDYRQITAKPGDVLYLDPPYETGEGRYYSGLFDFDELFGWLRAQPCSYYLSLNGFLGGADRRLNVPTDLYDEQLLIENGQNSIDHIAGREARRVTESLYIRRRSFRASVGS
jgi:DNA adenine methylase